jgi:23S rRNA pseudouridine2605 synthase
MDRIQKILARGGIASRRAAEQLITAGRVRVNGRVVTELGAKADPRKDRVEVDGKRVVAEERVYVVLHKPRGVVSTMSDPEGRPTVRELLQAIGGRVYPVGRLDFATSGVLLATNDGDFADGMLHPRKEVPKTYVLKVKGEMKPDDVEVWRKGIRLEDGMTLPADARLIRHESGKTWLTLTIKEGRNQQIRRMGEATRFPVMRLARVEFAGVTIEGLRPGAWRHLTRDELMALKKTYGVPKSIPAIPEQTPQPRGRPQPHRPADDRARNERSRGPARGARSESSRGGADRPRSEGPRAGGDSRTQGPRYGGGSPARRGYDVLDDWGGGAGRGSSSGRSSSSSSSPNDESRGSWSGGRGGRTRTTGTSGGIGSRDDAPRVKGRRGR